MQDVSEQIVCLLRASIAQKERGSAGKREQLGQLEFDPL